MTDYPNTVQAECMLVLNLENLVYLFALNAVFILIPCVSLFLVYIYIILKLKRGPMLKMSNQIVYHRKQTQAKSNETKTLTLSETDIHQIELRSIQNRNSKVTLQTVRYLVWAL